MIELSSNHRLVREHGTPVSLDLEAVRSEIRACCAQVGLRDGWLADQITLALEDYFLAGQHEQTSCPTREEIDHLICRLLVATGYAEVAGEFGRRRSVTLVDAADLAALPCSEARVQELLAKRLPLPAETVVALGTRVLEKLGDLGFARVTDTLVLEIAGQLVREPAAGIIAVESSPWLLPPGFWQGLLVGEPARLCRQEILQPLPVSRLLPAVRLVLELRHLAASAHTLPVTELQFWPRLHRATKAARRVLLLTREQVARSLPCYASTPSRIIVAGCAGLADAYMGPMTRAQARYLVREVRAVVQKDVGAGLEFPLLVTLQDEGR